MSTDNFGALGADFFIKTFNKGSSMSQADLDALVQYVQLTSTIMAIGDFTPNEQDSVWMILERVDVPSAPGYTVTNNTEVTMTSGGMVTIDSIPWTKVTGKPTLFTANQTLNTSDSVSFNRLTVTGASGIEGGEIELAKAPTSTLAGNVVIDVYENKLRFFEGGGNGRGFYLDLTTGANNTSTDIMSGGGGSGGPTTWTSITGKPSIPTDINDLTDTDGLLANIGDFEFTGGTASLPAGDTMVLDTFQVDGNKQSTLTLSTATISSLDAGNNLRLRTGYGTGFEKDWILGADGSIRFPDASVQTTAYTGSDHEAYEITNTSPEGPTYSVSVGTDGVVTMVTSRGNLEFGALPEPGGPTHFHIMRPAGDNGTDLYFGDDYNYVLQRPSAYGGAPAYGVEIGANDNNGGDQQVWRFGTDGDLVLPAGKTIRDTTGTDLLADDTGGDPAYKGFKAHYGRMWGNNDDPNGPINKIVIYKDTATPSSTIDTSTNNDTFTVTGLTGSDIVAMLVVVGDEVSQTTTAELKTFAESIIDNVILDEGVEGDLNSINAMRTAFYDSFATFSATLTDLKTNFEFFSVNNQFTVLATSSNPGSAVISNISYNMNNDTLDLSGWTNGFSYTVGDVITILGTDIRDADNNSLASPDNDVTVTITAVVGNSEGQNAIQSYSVTGTLPRPQEVWPSNSIGDGGDDEYDTGNYITTNLESEISYNNGDVVSSSNAFGGGDYVVTYQNSIFGIFAVNPAIDSIATQGSSGFDGDGQADTGSLYSAADSGVNIGDFVFTGSTLTATDDDLYIKAVDDLWLDALQDDIHIRANDDVRIKVGYDFDADSAQQEWRFDTSGYINFPDGSQQTTAYTGNSFSGNYSDLTNRPTGTTAVHDLIGGASSDDNGKYLKQTSLGVSEWSSIPASFSGVYADLTSKPTLFDGDYNSLTNKPTIRIAVPTGSGPGGNLQADSLALAGLNPVTDIPSTWGGDLILQGGVGGANSDLYGEVRIKSGQIGANYEWHFTTDKKIKLPAGGSIVDSAGANVFVSLTTLKQVVADSTDFADFQSRIAGML